MERNDDRLISFCLEVVYADRKVRFAFAGHVVDLKGLLDNIGTSLPSTITEIPAWLEQAQIRVNQCRTDLVDEPPLARLLRQTGILQFLRNTVAQEFLDIDNGREGLDKIRIAIPRTETVLLDLVQRGVIVPERTHQINRSKCSGCDAEYRACKCSKYLINDVHQIVTEASIVDFFWTNRSANR